MARKGVPFMYRRKGGQLQSEARSNQKQKQKVQTCDDSDSSQEFHDHGLKTTTFLAESTKKSSSQHYHCYLLRSLDENHPQMTYIGFTTNPHRRIRQHNGDLKKGGARRTRISGRPWTFVLVLHGFHDNTTALQFEWAWQHPNKSKAFKDALGDDAVVAGLLSRRRGIEAKLHILRILLCHAEPYCRLPLNIYFLQQEYMHSFLQLLQRRSETDLSPSRKSTMSLNINNNSTQLLPSQMTMQTVGSLEELPFFRDKVQKKKGLDTNLIGHGMNDSNSCTSEDIHDDADDEDTSKISERDSSEGESLNDLSTHLLHMSILEEDEEKDSQFSPHDNDTIYLSDSYSPGGRGKHDVIILSDNSSYYVSATYSINAYSDQDEDSSCGTINLLSSPDQIMNSPASCSIPESYPTHRTLPVKPRSIQSLTIVDLCSP